MLHGLLETGDACTLFGKFNTALSGFSVKQGFATKNGESYFSFAVLGDLLSDDKIIQKVEFSLSGMEEFFIPNGFKDEAKYKIDPLFSWETSYGCFEVGLKASFKSIGGDITARIYSRNETANEELRTAYSDVIKNNPEAYFMHREKITYRAFLRTTKPASCTELYEHISTLAGLFSVLINAPVHPEDIIASTREAQEPAPTKLVLLPSIMLDSRTIELTKQKRSHFNMPLTNSTIDLTQIAKKWLEIPKRNSVMISSIQHETGVRTEHSAHGDIVLYTTQLEAISHTDGKKNEKYSYPIRRYGETTLQLALGTIAKKYGHSEIGEFVSSIRNEIAHVGRPKKILVQITLRDLVDISRILQLAVLGSMLHDLGVSTEGISKYMRVFCPKIVSFDEFRPD